MKFRNKPLYRGEFFVALIIPSNEDRDIVPLAAKPNPNGSYRLVIDVLYAVGDLCFARERAKAILSHHPTWEAGIYRADSGAFMGAV